MYHPGTKTPSRPIPEHTNGVARRVVDAAFAVHSNLGPGLLESVYETYLVHELAKRNLRVQCQIALPIRYDGIERDTDLRLNLLVEDGVIVELKAVEILLPVHEAQLLTYLKFTGHRLGLLIHFNVPLIRDGIKRMAL